MDKKKLEEQFLNDMDAYINGIKLPNQIVSDEYEEILDLGKKLANQDFSQHSKKEEILTQSLKMMETYKGGYNMKKTNKIKRFTIVAASIGILLFGSITLVKPSFAENIVDKIIQTFSAGQLQGIQSESPETKVVPAELKGKLYDKDGNIIEVVSNKNPVTMYTADGEKIVGISGNNEIITESEQAKLDREDDKLVVTDSGELNKYTRFDVILPSYLPEGYTFDQAEFVLDEHGNIYDEFILIRFTNQKFGKTFIFTQMLGTKENAYQITTYGKMKQVKINGIDAILADDRNLDWEHNNIFYGISGKEAISSTEIMKIAESIR